MPREFTEEQKSARREYLKQWRRDHPEEARAQRARAYAKARLDPVAVAKNRANAAKGQRATPELANAANRAWRRRHPEKSAAIGKANCANRRAAPGKLTPEEVRGLQQTSDGVCAYCLRPHAKLVLEHVIPISRGGGNTLDNIVMACQRCNNSKGSKTPLEFLLGWPRVTEKLLTTQPDGGTIIG